MIDPMISLAYAIHAGPAVYALLLGAGVSRAAGIPTGQQIVLELARRVARIEGADPEPDAVAWFRRRFGSEPTYSTLLEALLPTGADRANALRAFFEPTLEEQARGEKMPTKAHRAIAKLVASGHVRVILTTNFDPLMERALDEQGVRPVVISSAGAVPAATPLAHSRCTVIKLHGDYLDLATRNTPTELADYEEPVRDLLARILDEYGLVVCGWSAEHDTALRGVIEACPSRRFGAYWAVQTAPNEAMRRLMDFQGARVIPIQDADTFFTELEEKVTTIDRLAAPHPLSGAIAVESLKRYLPDEKQRIALDDLVMREIERLTEGLGSDRFPVAFTLDTRPEERKAEIGQRLERYEALTDTCLVLFSTGVWWGAENHRNLWVRGLTRLLNYREERIGSELLIALLLYPALLCFYGGGLAAVVRRDFGTLRAIVDEPRWRDLDRQVPLVHALRVYSVLNMDTIAASEHLSRVVRGSFRELIRDDRDYEQSFDYFEYLLALLQADRAEDGMYLGPDLGRWAKTLYRSARYDPSRQPSAVVDQELREQESGWAPIQAGLFSSAGRVREIKARVDQSVMQQGVRPW